jgi:capsular polysaccharide biosynthesis protein
MSATGPVVKETGLARHHTFLDRLFDLKPRAFALSEAVLGHHPRTRVLSGFFPDFIWPDAARVKVFEDRRWRHNLAAAEYDDVRPLVCDRNVDVLNPLDIACEPGVSRTMIAEIAGVVVPGHTLTAVDAASGSQISLGQQGKARWSFAYPGPIALKRIVVDQPCLAIPPIRHYGHLMTDVLMPICEAIRIGAISEREELVIFTGDHPPLVSFFIDGMRALGLRVRQMPLKPTEHVVTDRYLYARSHSPNIEQIFGVPEACATALALFQAAYREQPAIVAPRRVYLRRKGHRQRVVAGEDALVARLVQADFTVLEPDWTNHSDQIAACSGADVIAAVHGAALANVLFCKPGSTVVELMATDGRKSTGLHWSAAAGARYVPVFGGKEGGKQSFAVDPEDAAREIIAAAERAGPR